MKLMIGCNLLTSVQTLAYYPHMNFWYYLGKNHPDWTIYSNMPRRYSIDRMRNETAQKAMELECDWLMFYDDDVMFSPSAIDTLLEETPGDVRGGITLVRGHPFRPMAFKWDDNKLVSYNDYESQVGEDGILPVAALGFSLVMIKVDLLKKMQPPFFMTGTHNTEDVYFCLRAKDHDPTCEININTNVPTYHILDSYYISPANRNGFIDLEMYLGNVFHDKPSREDRPAEYHEYVMEQIRKKVVQE